MTMKINIHIPNPFLKSPLSTAYWSLSTNQHPFILKEWELRNYDPLWLIDYAMVHMSL